MGVKLPKLLTMTKPINTRSTPALQLLLWAIGVTAAIAKAFAESEFEQYRIIQDRLYQSDFDRLIASTGV